MADFAAHLNQRQSLSRPSFFELVAQDGVETTMRRAFEYFLKQIANYQPENYGWLLHYCDEVYALFSCLLQYHCIYQYEASLAENFYGMKRVSATRHKGKSGILSQRMISDVQRRLSMFFLVVVPYIKLKLDRRHSDLQEEQETGPNTSAPTLTQRLNESFSAAYPYISFAWESSALLYQLLYLFKYSKFYSPSLKLSGVQLVRMTKEDLLLQPSSASPGSSVVRLLGFVVGLLAKAVPVGVFFLKFLNWWHSDEHAATTAAITRLPVPPPPEPMQPVPGVNLPPHPAQCPLCFKSRRTAAVLTTSGYVFCYACAHDYVEQHGRCPITHVPTTALQLVRLYPNN